MNKYAQLLGGGFAPEDEKKRYTVAIITPWGETMSSVAVPKEITREEFFDTVLLPCLESVGVGIGELYEWITEREPR